MTQFRTGAAPVIAQTTTHATRVRGTAIAVVAFALGACAYPLEAQVAPPASLPPGTTSGAPTVLAPYRAPAIALVQPLPGGTLPQDRAALVIRFAQGEPDDPIDVASFAVAVDGQVRTKEFQVTATQAWGTLGAPDDAAKRLAIGAHHVALRICSTRNACALADASVTVLPPMEGGDPAASAPVQASKVKRALGALMNAGRKLLAP